MLNRINFETFDDMIQDAAQRIQKLADQCIREKGSFSLALSGGSTPAPLYSLLATMDFPWDKIDLFWGDERLVPLDSELSNYRMVYEKLISKITITDDNVHIVLVDLPPEVAAERYETEVQNHSPIFDLILLGIGPDGHTASLFPDSPALNEKTRLVVAVPPPTTVKPAVPRITFTFPLINNAKNILFMATGEEKRKLFDVEEDFPFKLVKNADIFYAQTK